MNKYIIVASIAILLVGGFIVFSRQQRTTLNQPQTQTEAQTETLQTAPAEIQKSKTKIVKVTDIANAHADYKFSATIPASWEAQAVTEIDSINIYDPAAADSSNLEKSQIFIRKFSANSFLTLSTVTIHKREELTVNNRPAVRYDIEKKAGVADFPNEPSWRNKRHFVTDVRVSDTNPSVFYIIGRRPDVDEKIFQQFLDSLQVVEKSSLIEPIDEFKKRITKKPFGIFITPETSPVQPERFRGFHTAVDVEYDDKTEEIPIRSIADGTVAMATTASGYGGVLVVRHEIGEKTHTVIYGHVDPKSLPKVGEKVKAGQQVAVLGDHLSSETDGGRKHLHLGIRADNTLNILGYVKNKEELTGWLDPLTLY